MRPYLYRGAFDPLYDRSQVWKRWANQQAETTASWYTGENIEGKPIGFMPYIGGYAAYKEKCEDVSARGYAGFTRS